MATGEKKALVVSDKLKYVYGISKDGTVVPLLNGNSSYFYSVQTNSNSRVGIRITTKNNNYSSQDYIYTTDYENYGKYQNDYSFISPLVYNDHTNSQIAPAQIRYTNTEYYAILLSNVKLPDNITAKRDSTGYTLSDSSGSVISELPQTSTGGVYNSYAVCFLSGTLIATPTGLVSVEDLRVGDEVFSYHTDGSSSVDTLTWVGKAEAFVRQNVYAKNADYPIRILKDAIADGVPFKDLLITSEHCLFFDGKFIPARMLVNGLSIHYDTSFTSYDYFHIETEKHSVIMADGMLTESYLDTGNRNAFLQEGSVFVLGQQKTKTWENDAAFPLTVTRNVVEPIYNQIKVRAQNMQRPVITETASLTADTNLHLRTKDGQIIRPVRKCEDRVFFVIPAHSDAVQIVSNASRPSEAIGPFVDDRRTLGVLVSQISLFVNNQQSFITDHLHNEYLDGWYKIESSTMRWSDGNAFLPLPDTILEKPTLLSLQIIAAGPYIVPTEQLTQAVIAA